jgi:hypothetical protein
MVGAEIAHDRKGKAMLIDCDGCSVRGRACGTCVVTLLLDAPPALNGVGEAEAQAIEVFALAGFDVTVLDPTADVATGAAAGGTADGPRTLGWHAA